MLEHKLRAALITLYWDGLLRLAASLRHGWTPRGAAACQGSGRMPLASGGPRLVRAAGAIANVLRPGDFNATERPSRPTADRFVASGARHVAVCGRSIARRPLLLLDIDGTLCPIGPAPGHAMTWLPGEAGDKYFRSNLPAVLAELGGRYELVWATAWENHANLILAPALGLPSLPVVRFSDPGARGGRPRMGRQDLEAAQRPALRGPAIAGLG